MTETTGFLVPISMLVLWLFLQFMIFVDERREKQECAN